MTRFIVLGAVRGLSPPARRRSDRYASGCRAGIVQGVPAARRSSESV